jgi:Short C-terminal domain
VVASRDRLEELTARHQSGALSDAEYAAERDRLLTER